MAQGNVKELYPPQNDGTHQGSGKVQDAFDGTEYVFHTPDANNWSNIKVGDSVTFDKDTQYVTTPQGENVTRTTISNITLTGDSADG